MSEVLNLELPSHLAHHNISQPTYTMSETHVPHSYAVEQGTFDFSGGEIIALTTAAALAVGSTVALQIWKVRNRDR